MGAIEHVDYFSSCKGTTKIAYVQARGDFLMVFF